MRITLCRTMPDEGVPDRFSFVVNTPKTRGSSANKKRVRSIAALRSWPERRKKTSRQRDQEPAQVSSSANDSKSDVDPLEPTTTEQGSQESKVQHVGLDRATAYRTSDSSRETPRQIDEEPLFEKCVPTVNEFCGCTHCRSEDRHRRVLPQSQLTRPVPLSAGAESRSKKRKRASIDRTKQDYSTRDLAMLTPPSSPSPSPLAMTNSLSKNEPFNCYPVPTQPWFDRILHHSKHIHVQHGRKAFKTDLASQCSRCSLLEVGRPSRSPTLKAFAGSV